MKCVQCGNEILSSGVTDGEYMFCNNLCKYVWREGGHENPAIKMNFGDSGSGLFLKNLDFVIYHPRIQNKKLLLRSSYWVGPKLYADDQKLKPVSRTFFKKTKTYRLADSESANFEVKVKSRWMDAIPEVYIDNKKIEFAARLNVFEYILLWIPLLLVIVGGLIGGLIGGAAVFTNSILLRKIRHTLLRYFMVVVTIVLAYVIFVSIIIKIAPFTNEMQFKLEQSFPVGVGNPKTAPLTRHIWKMVKVIGADKREHTDAGFPGIGSQWYFFENFRIAEKIPGGLMAYGKWSVDPEVKVLTDNLSGQEERLAISELNDTEMILTLNGVSLYYAAVW